MGSPIQIVADVPSSSPRLGFETYAEALADAIRGGIPPQFTIGVYGPWGSGKEE
jgi:RecA/RadA recombinase